MEYNLERFVKAQEGDYERAMKELARGHKQSHWIWYILPNIAGLGHSPTARYYAIQDLEEAKAYLAHPLLGPRLQKTLQVILEQPNADLSSLMGFPDDLKLISCVSLFQAADPDNPIYKKVLKRFHREPDWNTLAILGK